MLTDDFLVSNPDTAAPGQIFLATVASVTDDGVSILFDGTDSGSTKRYKQLNTGITLDEGDRIAVVKDAGSYIVLGKIAYTNSGGGGGDYVEKTGDTMTGVLRMSGSGYIVRKITSIDRDSPSAADAAVLTITDKNDKLIAREGINALGGTTNPIRWSAGAARAVSNETIYNTISLGIDNTGERSVQVTVPALWADAIGYHAGDSITLGTLSYIQFAGGWRQTNNALNFTIPLSRPVASGVTATVSGKVILYDPDIVNGSNHYATIDLADASTLSAIVSEVGVTVHATYSSAPSYFIANKPLGIQAYGLTITFS